MRRVIYIFSFFFFISAYPQGFKHFSIENGLASNLIYKIIQDTDGFIWIATDKGISKFDGKTFKNFSTSNGLPSNDIWEIVPTSDHKIWYFTRSNSLGYIKNDSVFNFFGKDKSTLFYPKHGTDGKDIIFSSYGKSYKLVKNQWEEINTHQPNMRCAPILHPKVKLVKFDTINSKYRLRCFNDKNEVLSKYFFSEKKKLFNQQLNDSLYVIRFYNNIYFLNFNDFKLHKIKKIDFSKNKEFMRFYSGKNHIQISSSHYYYELDSNYKLINYKKIDDKFNASNVFKDAKGNFWISSYNKGVFMLPNSAKDSKYYLSNHKIKFLRKSIKNIIYTGALDEGLFVYNDENDKFELLFPLKSYFYDVYLIDRKNFVVFGYRTTYVMKDGHLTTYKPKYLQKKAVGFNNNFYVTTLRGLNKFDSDLKFTKFIPLKTPILLTNYNNRLIVANTKTLYEIKDDVPDKLDFIEKNVPHLIISLANYKNNLLIGTDGFGVYIWDGKNSIKQVEGTKSLIVNSIVVKGDKIWVGTQNGVRVYQDISGNFKFFQTLRKTDGLVSDQVIDIDFLKNNLFVASFNGISKTPLDRSPNLPLQKIYIKDIKYGKKHLTSQQYETKYNKKSNLQVNFGTIDFSGQEHNDYYYKLSPVQNFWSKTLSNNLEFSQLSPNNYILEIKAKNPYGQILTKQFNFFIKPLWWQTKWANILFIFFGLFTIFAITYLLRKKELAKQRKKLIAQKEKVEFELYALRSQMNPHFVFNSLNAIQFYISEGNFDKSESYLVKFSRLIRMIFDFSRYKNVSINQEIKLLKSYLEIEKMRFGDDFNYCINTSSGLLNSSFEIPTMLLQPIVENAVNHGIFHKKGKGTICLEFVKIDEKTLKISIKDDGVGIEKSKEINRKSLRKHKSRSTDILKKRIKLLNLSGKWKIEYELLDLSGTDNKFVTEIILKIKRL